MPNDCLWIGVEVAVIFSFNLLSIVGLRWKLPFFLSIKESSLAQLNFVVIEAILTIYHVQFGR